jgi:hypothetical protein
LFFLNVLEKREGNEDRCHPYDISGQEKRRHSKTC